MEKTSSSLVLRIGNLLSFVVMVIVNALANILPINGIGTGAVSDSYPNLFAPAGITFSIWGVIYVLLLLFSLYQLGIFGGNHELVKRIGPLFIISSLANTAWIFSWHYRIIPLSLVLMLVILVSLIMAYTRISRADLLSLRDRLFMRLPFSIYFGWITVATIANVTALLVDLGWNGFGLSAEFWTIVAMGAGAVIGIWTMLKFKDPFYGLVILWAYLGILLKHLPSGPFAGGYSGVIIAVIVVLAAVLAADVTSAFLSAKRKARQVSNNVEKAS